METLAEHVVVPPRGNHAHGVGFKVDGQCREELQHAQRRPKHLKIEAQRSIISHQDRDPSYILHGVYYRILQRRGQQPEVHTTQGTYLFIDDHNGLTAPRRKDGERG